MQEVRRHGPRGAIRAAPSGRASGSFSYRVCRGRRQPHTMRS